jgi:hypothetical protein
VTAGGVVEDVAGVGGSWVGGEGRGRTCWTAAVARWVALVVGLWLCRWPVTRAGASGEVVWRRLRGAVRVGGQRLQDRAGGGAQCKWARWYEQAGMCGGVRKKFVFVEMLSKLRFFGTP